MTSAAATLAQIAGACGGDLPLPPRGDEQVFAEPWQAQVFAMTVLLHERGVFTWPEWAQCLGEQLSGGAEDGSDYYQRWADALEAMLTQRALVSPDDLIAATDAWHAAAARTPHGHPIEL